MVLVKMPPPEKYPRKIAPWKLPPEICPQRRMPIIFGRQMFSLRVLLSICLIFCQFQPGVAYKSVAYKKARVVRRTAKKLPSC